MLEIYKESIRGLCQAGAEQIAQTRMRVFLVSALALCATIFTQARVVDDYVSREGPIAKAGLLANIGSTGAKSLGARPGVVVASPNRVDPDYVYMWIRDSSLVFKLLVDQYTLGDDTSPAIRSLIDAFVTSQGRIQKVSNPSGTQATGGLGEPKFNIDETAFTDGWGRPQRDGPALRSTTLMIYSKWLLANQNGSQVTNVLWPIIKQDLDYTAQYWNQTGFDLWEEVSSSSFFTSAAQHRALREGAAFARQLGQTSVAATYEEQANNVLCFLQSYWNPTGKYITSNTGGGRSGIDANSALASIHNFDPEAGCDVATYQPCSDKALSSLKVYVDSFRQIYSINKGIPANQAVATGRYPEDVYYGGNPWYLGVAAVAEQLYDSIITWNRQGNIPITDISLPFFRQFSPSVNPGTYASSSSTFQTLNTAVKAFADGFIAILEKYTPTDGSLAEQFGRDNGLPLSAKDLTWSYASALTAFNARAGKTSASWGAKGLVVPAVCHNNPGPTVDITFNEQATTQFGENIFLAGSIDVLKGWSPDNAVALSSANYPIWSATVKIPASTNFEYKYIRKFNGVVTWESGSNRFFASPQNGTYILNDSWR
ncbi:glycoside hydrolase family 15 protein [Pluteus cervinus]|uniref:Glycoside hydrolase family 15 protein n=1 Tax=Pluteus cervinus TaxID=181527 RepID=A0ACD3B9H9_9AGAR|nr:glycoside hydrolase family 15 protein [Pluteus cervinus]